MISVMIASLLVGRMMIPTALELVRSLANIWKLLETATSIPHTRLRSSYMAGLEPGGTGIFAI